MMKEAALNMAGASHPAENGGGTADILQLEALTDNLPQVMAFIDSRLEAAGCSVKTQMRIDLAAEEIFVNIAHYAYMPETGSVEIRMEVGGDPVEMALTFIDSGVPYNPLERDDPDITLTAQDRKIGGLGIFLTKKNMDEVTYRNVDGQNILTMRKKL